MKESRIHVARDGVALGLLPLEAVRALLAEGFLKRTDDFLMAGNEDWQPLALLEASVEKEVGGPSFKTLAAKTAEATRALAQQIAGRSAALTSSTVGASTLVANKLLEGFLPRIESQLVARLASLGRTSASALNDEEFLQKVFGALYDCIPKPAYRFVSEKQFIEFCHKHRRALLSGSKANPK